MKKPTFLILASLYLSVANAAQDGSSPLRGNAQNRRHLLQDDAECVLYLKDIEYEGHREGSIWTCEFSRKEAETFGGQEIMAIEGLSKEIIESMNAVSGESILKTKGAFVEHFLGSHQVKMMIPRQAAFGIEPMSENDPRKHRQPIRRNLAGSRPGTLRTLVVRVIDGSGTEPTANAARLRDDIFEDRVSLKTQYAACSKDQAIIEPAAEGNGGIVDVKISTRVTDNISNIQFEMENEARQKAEQLYGGNNGLQSKYDLVMFCMPPGTGSWLAYAYINRWDSFYNDEWCQSVSAQMHEVGHNLGLGHSGTDGNPYGDESGMMGYSYFEDDGPEKCFNAAKNYQLRWYERQSKSVDPLTMGDAEKFVFNGVDDYKTSSNTGDKLITLRLKQYGDTFRGSDYFIGYNRASGPNRGVNEEADRVTIYRKESGGEYGYGESTRVAALAQGQNYRISNFKNSGTSVYIYVMSISNDQTDASVILSRGELVTSLPEPPVPSPTEAPGCADANNWTFRGRPNKDCKWIAKGPALTTFKRCNKLDRNTRVYDQCKETCGDVGLGSCAKTITCEDDLSFRFENNNSKGCENWVFKSKNKRQAKTRCNKKVGNKGFRVYDYCNRTCGMVGLGSCDQF